VIIEDVIEATRQHGLYLGMTCGKNPRYTKATGG
jgi:hypothetical protein